MIVAALDPVRGHRPAMVAEVLDALQAGPAATGPFVDGTVGLGGHAEALLDACPDAALLGIDRDPRALELARARLARFGARVRLAHGSFAELPALLVAQGLPAPMGILLDLGVSSLQLDDPARGFSFRFPDAPLDMRFDPTDEGAETVGAWLARVRERDLADLLHFEGDEPRSRAVARAIVAARPFATLGELAEVVRRHAARGRRIDPATRVFQALRIAVNDEMGHVERGLRAALAALAPGGTLVVLCFQGGEERRVKAAFQEARVAGLGAALAKKPLRPTAAEVASNPRARATRLRAFRRGATGEGEDA